MINRISQSFMKDMEAYLEGEECGNIIKYRYIDKKEIEKQSKYMAHGTYFEFLLSAALPRNGVKPEPVYTKTGMKKDAAKRTVDDMDMNYKRIHFNVSVVKKVLDDWGLKIISSGKKLTKGKFEGTIDLIVECQKDMVFNAGHWNEIRWKKGDRMVFDVKYSGLIYNKWEKLGWLWSNIQKTYHGKQAKQYSYVSGLPFYFLVIGSNNVEVENDEGVKAFPLPDIKLFHCPVDKSMENAHLNEGNALLQKLEHHHEFGLQPRPEFKKCSECPIGDACKDKHTYPHPEVIDLTLTE